MPHLSGYPKINAFQDAIDKVNNSPKQSLLDIIKQQNEAQNVTTIRVKPSIRNILPNTSVLKQQEDLFRRAFIFDQNKVQIQPSLNKVANADTKDIAKFTNIQVKAPRIPFANFGDFIKSLFGGIK